MFYIPGQRCILFLLIQLLIHNVFVQSNKTHTAEVGDAVILPCTINQTAAGGDVFWRDKEGDIVVDFIGGKEDFLNQDPKYRDRVKALTTEMEKKDFSIKLSNVTLSDSGIYTCYITEPVHEVDLRVTEKTKPPNGDIRKSTTSMFLLGFSLLYSLAF